MMKKLYVVFMLILVASLLLGCGSKVQITGIESKTMMNGATYYFAHTPCGVRQVSQGVYATLQSKLAGLRPGKKLMCDMESGPDGVYDLVVCFQDVIVAKAGQ